MWDPDRYLLFSDHRTRPGIELVARIPEVHPGNIVDLGSGTGNLTARLSERWPSASVLGIDNSEAMVARARRDHHGVEFVVGDIAGWETESPVDLIFSNATLHWLDDHGALFARLRSYLAPGGVLAVQMPDNWAAPTHQIPAGILDGEEWPESVRAALLRDRLARPENYSDWIQPATVDMWRTTYYQQLTGDDPVWTWMTGSALRPVLAALDASPHLDRFTDICRQKYAAAYPETSQGITPVAFSRFFLVAVAT